MRFWRWRGNRRRVLPESVTLSLRTVPPRGLAGSTRVEAPATSFRPEWVMVIKLEESQPIPSTPGAPARLALAGGCPAERRSDFCVRRKSVSEGIRFGAFPSGAGAEDFV